MRAAYVLAVIVVILTTSLGAAADTLAIIDDGLTAGYVTLSWPECEGRTFTLQMDAGGGWRTVYRGPDRAHTMSGLEDGRYRFRLRADGGAWSPVLPLTVAHHPLAQALATLTVGAVVFCALIALLIVGHMRTRRRG